MGSDEGGVHLQVSAEKMGIILIDVELGAVNSPVPLADHLVLPLDDHLVAEVVSFLELMDQGLHEWGQQGVHIM